MSKEPQIYTFYSFKGGVGRTMTLMNLAYALAMRGRHVLMVDMDLEAPGLSGFMTRNDPPELKKEQLPRHDVIDLLIWAKRMVRDVPEEGPLPKMDSLDWPVSSDYMARVPAEKLGKTEDSLVEPGKLDVIPIDEDRDFYERMAELDIPNFTRTQLITVGSLLHEFFKSRRVTVEFPDYYGPMPDDERYVPYDYVFIDSRTGITEVGGLCIGPMSDELVVLCGLNDQNIEGTRAFLEQVGVLEPQGSDVPKVVKPTTFVASPIPDGNPGLKQQRLKTFEKRLGKISAKLPYHPQLGLLETIFVRDFEEENLTAQYQRLLTVFRSKTGHKFEVDISDLFQFGSTTSKGSTSKFRAMLRTAVESRDQQLLAMALGMVRQDSLFADEDFQLVDRAIRYEFEKGATPSFHALMRWGSLMHLWRGKNPTSPFVAARTRWGTECFGRALALPDLSPERKAMALINRGVTYSQQGEIELALTDYSAVLAMPDVPIEKKADALVNQSWADFRQGRLSDAISDARRAIKLGDDSVAVFCNLGVAYLADQQTDAAIEAYREALARATVEDLAILSKVLDEAVARFGVLLGADEVRGKIAARKDELVGGPGGDGTNV